MWCYETHSKYIVRLKHSRDAYPNSKVHGAHMGSIWGRQDPGGPHVGPMNFAIWVGSEDSNTSTDEGLSPSKPIGPPTKIFRLKSAGGHTCFKCYNPSSVDVLLSTEPGCFQSYNAIGLRFKAQQSKIEFKHRCCLWCVSSYPHHNRRPVLDKSIGVAYI